jgi:hypothetical protein
MIILVSLMFMLLLLWMLISKEGFSLTATTYSTQTTVAFTKYLKEQSSKNDDATIKNTISQYEKAGVPEASINAYVSTGKWPYSDTFKKLCLQKGTDLEMMGNITISSLRPMDVMCKVDASGNSTGKGMYSIKDSDYISNVELIKKIPGFTFLKDPCNPCDILNNNYDCPFSVPGTDKKPLLPDPVLRYVWNI